MMLEFPIWGVCHCWYILLLSLLHHVNLNYYNSLKLNYNSVHMPNSPILVTMSLMSVVWHLLDQHQFHGEIYNFEGIEVKFTGSFVTVLGKFVEHCQHSYVCL